MRARLRLPRPSPRGLSAILVVVGLLAGLAILVLPVEAAVDDDPLFRLAPFSPTLTQGVSSVDCGVPVSNFGRSSEGLSLYDLALDHACRGAASRRAATAAAAVSMIAVLGLITAAAPRIRRMATV